MVDNSAEPIVEEPIPGFEPENPEDSYTDADLQKEFRQALPELGPAPEAPIVETPETPAVDPRVVALETQLAEIQEQSQNNAITNDILRDQLAQERALRTQQPATPAAASTTPQVFGLEEFKAAAQNDPYGAIFKLFEQGQKASTSATEGVITQAQQAAAQIVARETYFNADKATTLATYGQLFESNPKFAQLANQIYGVMVGDAPEVKPGVRHRPRAFYEAASVAYAQMVQSGQITPTTLSAGVQPRNPASNTNNVVNLKERKPAPSNPLLGSGTVDNPASVGAGLPAAEQSRMRAAAARLRIPYDKYVRTYEHLKKNDPSFGGGN